MNDLPEKGWEWHHTLPRCMFGNTPPGIWLTQKQHAIATAYQTLAFNHCCLYGTHLKLLPKKLLNLVLPIYRQRARNQGVKNVESGHLDFARSLRDPEKLVNLGERLGNLNVESGFLESLRTPNHQREAGRKSAQKLHAQRWMCTVTGKISTPGGLSSWQNARGIDTKHRVKVSEEA